MLGLPRPPKRTKARERIREINDADFELDLGIKEMGLEFEGDVIPKIRKPIVLKWRKYRNTRRAHVRRTRRILIVETIKKGNESYAISGLNKQELNKILEALR